VRVGKGAAARIRHANILLAVDESDDGGRIKDVEAARAFVASMRAIKTLRRRLAEEGLDAALDRKKQVRPSVERIFDGENEAKLIAIAYGPKPDGRTLELLADRVVELKIVEHCSAQTVMRVLQKTRSSPGRKRCGASTPSPTPSSCAPWRTSWPSTNARTTRHARSSALTGKASN